MHSTQYHTFPWEDLTKWYIKHGRHHLPWRNYTQKEDTRLYHVWLSEILLQQTQVDRVIPYFQRIIERYPTIHDLRTTEYDTFFPYYQGMGYYSRARNLLKTACIISESYDGIFPSEKNILMKLPGVGGYTSSAILAFGYGLPYLAWDTNLEKVFSRYYHGTKYQKLTPEEKEKIENDFTTFCIGHTPDTLSPMSTADRVRSINNALMDFAATVDLKNPDAIDWDNYPLQSGVWYETGGSLEPKDEKKSITFPTPDATVIVILHENHTTYYTDTKALGESEKALIYSLQDHLGAKISQLMTHSGYIPFILPPALSRDTRKYVQEYFRSQYHLELSVRPVHKKWLSEDGKPYIVVNTQIQVGDVDKLRKVAIPR